MQFRQHLEELQQRLDTRLTFGRLQGAIDVPGIGIPRKYLLGTDAVRGEHDRLPLCRRVLRRIYSLVQAGQAAAGLNGFTPASDKLRNVDVSDHVQTHFDYQGNVSLR